MAEYLLSNSMTGFFFQWSTIKIISCSQISKSAGQFVRGYNASYFDIILEEVSIKKNGEEFSVEFKNIRTLWSDKIRSLWFVNEVPILSKSFFYTFWWLRTKYNYGFKLYMNYSSFPLIYLLIYLSTVEKLKNQNVTKTESKFS